MTDVFGRRVDNVEYYSCRHDAVDDGLQPRGKNRLSHMGFPVNEIEGPTVFRPAVAEETDKRVTMSVMALPSRVKSPHAYRNLNNKTNIQGPEDYWNRVSWRSREPTAGFTHPTSMRSRGCLLPGVSREMLNKDARRR